MLVRLGVWLVCAAASAYGAARPRVLGGADDAHNHFPFAVVFESYTIITAKQQDYVSRRTCSGSLITQTWVLTAAHCVASASSGKPTSDRRIRYGDFEKLPNETTKFSKVLKQVPHSNFVGFYNTDQYINNNDIGLALVEPVPSPSLATLSAVDYRCLAGQRAELAGFSPMTQINPTVTQDTRPLQVLEVMISTCKLHYPVFGEIKVNPTICVASKCGEDSIATAGDSGGPLLHDGRLVGVASFSVYNARINTAGYTPISPYLNWIRGVVGTKTL